MTGAAGSLDVCLGPVIAADNFRLEGGKVVDWDVMQEEISAEKSVNGNAMFPVT